MNSKYITSIAIALAASSFCNGAFAHSDHEENSIGKAGDAAKASRTIDVSMSDAMRFSPAQVTAKAGETIRFNVKNDGKLLHEMVLGDVAELKEHAEAMKKFPTMEHVDPNQVSVAPGKSGVLVWQFTKAGTVNFGCLQPGHYEAGMAGKVLVSSAK